VPWFVASGISLVAGTAQRGVEKHSSLTLFLRVNGTLSATDTSAPFGMSFDSSKYPDGQVTLRARAYDAAGNVASSSTVTFTVANDTVSPTVPISVSATDNGRSRRSS